MISEEQIELLVERLVNRIEEANTYFLMKMGSSIKQIRNLTPTQAQQLVQILKYGGNYEDIIREIAKYTNLNVKDIDDIFSSYAKKDQLFYEKFYKYRNIPFVEYAQNEALKRQTEALANIVKNEMYNFTRANVLGYTIRDLQGRPQFMGLRETYNRVLDEALVNVGTGKETFDSAMSKILKDIGGSGLKTVEYASGRSMRLDSAVRMNLKSRLRELHNENQKIFGTEFGADGYEISVHSNPAIDHEKVQGRQFSIVEYDRLNSGMEAFDYKGNKYTLDHDDKNGYRPISELNCYHYIFSIVLGVSEPEYTDKQLKEIIDSNNKGFEFEGKHYTNYEGTQIQRNLERAIREQKDTQILAKASGNNELVGEAQQRITQLTHKYNELSKVSGLPTKKKRLTVSGYRRTSVNNKIVTKNNSNVIKTENKILKNNNFNQESKVIAKVPNITQQEAIDTLKYYENKMVNLKEEHAISILDDGTIFHSIGINDEVQPYRDIEQNLELKDKKIKYMTHSHPISEKSYTFGDTDRSTWNNHPELLVSRQVSYDENENYIYENQFSRLDLTIDKVPNKQFIDYTPDEMEYFYNIRLAKNSLEKDLKFGFTRKIRKKVK